MAGNVGRPRKNSPRRRGGTAREEILDAAAELFTTQGFATTSTHQIADAVGIRQASLYYYFPSKTEIFLTLLNSTVNPAVELAERFSTIGDLTPELRLWSLVAAETRLLLSQRWRTSASCISCRLPPPRILPNSMRSVPACRQHSASSQRTSQARRSNPHSTTCPSTSHYP